MPEEVSVHPPMPVVPVDFSIRCVQLATLALTVDICSEDNATSTPPSIVKRNVLSTQMSRARKQAKPGDEWDRESMMSLFLTLMSLVVLGDS